ncbi:MAG: HAD-IIB family hydrolase [Woeseiaceae bacterium]
MFTDLDGTLLDHHTYNWSPAAEALAALSRSAIPVVLVSSKTAVEMESYRSALELNDPIVAENGAVISVPDGYFANALPVSVPVSRATLQNAYTDIKILGDFRCEAFFELGVEGIVRETGLTAAQAQQADKRTASEPIRWRDTEVREREFVDAAATRGLRCVRGGRFLHLMGDVGKEDAVNALLSAFAADDSSQSFMSVSLGDGPNDLGMLGATDIAVVLPGKHAHAMSITTAGTVHHAKLAGPAGWNQAILGILETHGL